MQSTTATAGHRKYVELTFSRNVYLIVGDLLVLGIIRVEGTVLLVIAFTMGGVISFGWGHLICSSRSYVSGVVVLVLAPVPPSITVPNQTHMETPVAQVTTPAQRSLRTGFFFSP